MASSAEKMDRECDFLKHLFVRCRFYGRLSVTIFMSAIILAFTIAGNCLYERDSASHDSAMVMEGGACQYTVGPGARPSVSVT